ncbi:hypothetical protein Asal01_02785 [Fodinibius salicampi]
MEDFRITDIRSGNIDRKPQKDENWFHTETGFPPRAATTLRNLFRWMST